MNNELPKWEYRVQTIGSIFGTKDENMGDIESPVYILS